ncbi:MAG TPA: glutamyl-tRNA reductase, partial [Bacillales bacterium]|nr:glutamyl-tRNA reductase [Bacillales bacterium]
HEKKVLRKHTKSIINQLLRDPISGIKDLAADPDGEESLEWFTKIFAIEDEVKREIEKQTVKQRKEETERSSVSAAVQEAPIRP